MEGGECHSGRIGGMTTADGESGGRKSGGCSENGQGGCSLPARWQGRDGAARFMQTGWCASHLTHPAFISR